MSRRTASGPGPAPGASPGFAERLLDWFDVHGRKDLPWQLDPSPYRVWISEVMLQQTQVRTVIPYFEAFMADFPSARALADAPLDAVLHRWSGLGYYARARNLHAAAVRVRDEHAGELPEDLEGLVALPGIGRSTAGAILALSRDVREPILDGNVKRVLARHRGIEGYPGQTAVARTLWAAADALTPGERVGPYTQAIMDLGATVCLRKRPLCPACPVADDCVARRHGRQHELPAPKPRKDLPTRATVFVVLRDADGRVMLERRPPAGIWGGLWGFPECEPGTEVEGWCAQRLGLAVGAPRTLAPIAHGFTHYRLDIQPVLAEVRDAPLTTADRGVMEDPGRLWYNVASPEPVGLAAPVKVLIDRLSRDVGPER